MARSSGAKRKRQDEDVHRDTMRDMAMFAHKAEAQFYQRVAQLQIDIKAGRHAVYRFTGNRASSPAVMPEMSQADPLLIAKGLGQGGLGHGEPEQSNQLTTANDSAQTACPIQVDDVLATPVGIPGAKNCLLGISFVFTGDFKGLTRENVKILVGLHGGRVDDFPTTKTNYVVLGNDVDPYKLQILEKKHLKTINEAGLYDLIRTFAQTPPSDVLRLKRQRIEQDLKESVESRTTGSRDRYADEQNNAWSGEPRVAEDALRFAQSRVSLESAYHAPAPLTNVSNPASSANDSLYSSRASWTPEAPSVAQPALPYAPKSVLNSDVLKVIAAMPTQIVTPMQGTSAVVASAKAPPVVHDDRAKSITLDVSHSGSMRVLGSLHDPIESDETREDSYSPPSADVPGPAIEWGDANGRRKRLRGVSRPAVGLASLYHMSPSNVDADEDNKSESDYSPPPADTRPDVTGKQPMGSLPAAKTVRPTKAEKQAAHVQRMQEAARCRELKAARKAANKAAAQRAVTTKAAKKTTTQLQQKAKAPRRFQRLLQKVLETKDSADPVEVVPASNVATSQNTVPARALSIAPKTARINQERVIAKRPVREQQMAEESSADDESLQQTSRIKREHESQPPYSRYNVDTDSRKLLMRNDGGVDIGINSPLRDSDSQRPYGQRPLPHQWPYDRGSRGQANLETSEDAATITRRRDSHKDATRAPRNGNRAARQLAARQNSLPQEMLPPVPRRRIIVDEYGNKYIAIPATGPFADTPELQDLLNESGDPGLSARENARITQTRKQPTNVIDLEDSDYYEDPHPPRTGPKAMISKQKNTAQSSVVTLTKSQKRKAHRALLEQQRRDQHEQHRTALKQKKNAHKATKAPSKQDYASNNVQASNMPTYDPIPFERVPYVGKGYPVAPYVPELRGLVQPQPSQILSHARTPLPPMSARMQAPIPLPPGLPFQPSAMGAPLQPMYGQFPPPPPLAGFGGPPRPYSAQSGFASGPVPFQQMPVMPNNPGFPVASPYVQNPPYVQTPVFGQMSMYAPQPSAFMGQMAPAR